MCGIVAYVGDKVASEVIYNALLILQHRGQDAAGIVTSDSRKIFRRKGNGLVRDVFRESDMADLQGEYGVGHVRYPTAGVGDVAEAQPMYVNSPYGIAFAHNGNLINTSQLREDLYSKNFRHINTNSDSEILLNIFASSLKIGNGKREFADALFDAVSVVNELCKGAFAAVALIVGHGVLAFRDPMGIRPLVLGKRVKNGKAEYLFVSESAALDILGFERMRDVKPGEAIFVSEQGDLYSKVCAEKTKLMPCIFEQVYLARPDSVIDNISVYKTRLRMGEKLANKILSKYPNGHDIDVVIPIPDTGCTAALPLAYKLNVKYREGFVKNRYIGRTFIMQSQDRRSSVRRKLNVVKLEFQDKNVLLVDDSIVRGTTIHEIIALVREAGAKKVYLAVASPPIRFPNVYGIDMPLAQELVACNRTEQEVSDFLGADDLIYQDIDDLFDAGLEGNANIDGFEASVFTGKYISGNVNEAYLQELSDIRGGNR